MKKILAILLAGMLTATAFAGCGGGGESEAKGDSGSGDSALIDPSWPDASLFGDTKDVTLKVWAPDKAVDLTKKQIEAFKSHYSDVKFNIEVVAQGENDAATLIVNDPEKAADVFGFPSDQLNKLKDAQVLTEVAPAFAPSVKAFNAEKTVSSATFNIEGEDKLLAFPETNDNGYYLVYDKTVVKDPATLEGVLADCKAAGKTFVMDAGNGFYSCIFAFTGGAEIDGFEADGITQKFKDYDEDDVVDVLMAFGKLMKDYKGTFQSQDVANISTGFTNKKVGAGIDGTWNSAPDKSALGANFGAAKLPTVHVKYTKSGEEKDTQIVSMFGYKYIGVNSHTKYQVAAQILAYYLSGQECQEQRAKEIGWGPSNTEAQKAAGDDPILKAVSEQANFAVPQVNIAGTFWSAMGTLGSEMYKDGWNPTDRAATKQLFEKVIANVRDE